MSRITVTEVTAGSSLSVTEPNATINSVNNATGDVDASNVREEGLERRNFQTGFNTSIASLSKAGPTSFTHSTETLLVSGNNFEFGPFNRDSSMNELLKVRFSFWFYGARVVSPASAPRWNFKIKYKLGAGGTYIDFDTDSTTRRFQANTSLSETVYGWRMKRSVTIVSHFTKSGIASSADIYFGLFGWEDVTPGSQFTLEHIHGHVKLVKR
ncbi:MAG: hypothetical protein GY913_21445 [Proteobacteria bacterium]|nr:hypothetical protein [Actinomycetes bacterium]MCP4919474.1 hypothetical protein [Pseudomonadota bacterium]